MPTLFTALRSHQAKPKARSRTVASPEPHAEMVVAIGKPKKRRERIYRLSLTDRFKKIYPRSPRPTVIVIGAGLAGLSAAFELHSVGYDVLVVEGRGRLGGRVESLHKLVPGRVVEGGAELIGSNHHAWLSYKHKFRRFHLRFSDVLELSNSPVILGGFRLSNPEAKALRKELVRATQELNEAARSVNVDMPWKTAGASGLDRLSLKQVVDRMNASDLCKLALLEQLVTDNGVPADCQSYLGVLAMIKGGGGKSYWDDTEVFRCRGGNQQLAELLAGALPGGSVHLNRRVVGISISNQNVTVTLSKGKPLVADDVILAIPPSVWNDIEIKPRLPRRFKGQFGQNVKYLMNVRKNSWAPLSPSFSSDGPIDLTWQGTDQQPGPRAAFVAFSGAKDAEKCRRWTKRKERYMSLLSPIYPRLDQGVGRCKFMDWPSDKWTRGSYSFPAPGEVTLTGPLLRNGFQIRKGLRIRMHFAGEHTCYAFVGYMEGALQSGLRVAEQLARRDRIIR